VETDSLLGTCDARAAVTANLPQQLTPSAPRFLTPEERRVLTVERILAFLVGALALLKDITHGRRTRLPTGAALLRELVREKSATVLDLSSRAKVSQPAALAALIELEEKD